MSQSTLILDNNSSRSIKCEENQILDPNVLFITSGLRTLYRIPAVPPQDLPEDRLLKDRRGVGKIKERWC